MARDRGAVKAANVIEQNITDDYALYHGDCVEVARSLPEGSIHFSVSSIPFASLYVYSNSERDMGNCRTTTEFFEHFRYMAGEWLRVTMAGRLASIHVMNLPATIQHDGYIGVKDFRGDVVRLMESEGWIFHSEVCIWKDPVTAMQRTKALGLLHKQIKKDSAMCRQGIPDYLVTFRKPGDNPERVAHTDETFPVQVWQRYASPVWMDINPSNTLQRMSAREERDERHICPLQLEVIERAVELWTNPGDVVYDPFGGIGSSGYVALRRNRRTVMSELKPSYYRQMVANCEAAKKQGKLKGFIP